MSSQANCISKSPPRVVILLRSLEIGGAERQAVLLAKALHGAGWPVCVVTSYDKGGLADELRAAGVELHLAGKKGRWDMLGYLLRLTRLLRGLKPDIIHSYLDVSNLTGGALKAVSGQGEAGLGGAGFLYGPQPVRAFPSPGT